VARERLLKVHTSLYGRLHDSRLSPGSSRQVTSRLVLACRCGCFHSVASCRAPVPG
jgi:hypothetical protein